jgi:cyclopropane-fatty-acyl-phospholipid synthase
MRTIETLSSPRASFGTRRVRRWLADLCRRGVEARLAKLRRGQLVVRDEMRGVESTFGGSEPGLRVVLRVHDASFYVALATGGSLGASEAYMDGAWTTDDLPGVVRLFLQNRDVLDGIEGGLVRVTAPLQRLLHKLRRNSKSGSKRNIAAHYDLGDDLFALFLDESMTYSSAYFGDPEQVPSPDLPNRSLEEAQRAKIDRLCRKLELGDGDHLVEIGTGWGALALRAADRYGCRVTTTTISQKQAATARGRVRAAGLESRVAVETTDYRELAGSYDKLVSVEMVEAVGHQFLPEFFGRCAALLRPRGLMALQAITIADQHYARALRDVDFIKKYVFPGSFIPSVTALVQAATAGSDLRLVDLEDLGVHYAETLRRWRARFLANAPQVLALGYDQRFLRLWDFYLAYCEGGFEERFLSVVQMVFAKPDARARGKIVALHAARGGAAEQSATA